MGLTRNSLFRRMVRSLRAALITPLVLAACGLGSQVPWVRRANPSDYLPVLLAGVGLLLHLAATWFSTHTGPRRAGDEGDATALETPQEVVAARTLPRPATMVVTGLAVAAFLLPIVGGWSRAESSYSAVGGLLPWSDAEDYYAGSERLLVRGNVGDWNERRPLNATFLAARLWLTGDLRLALLLQGALAAVASLLAARALAADYGTGAGMMLFAGLLASASKHLATTLSETLGLTFGALAFAILWSGARDRSIVVLGGGTAVFSLALAARASALFAIPALVIWAAITFRSEKRYSVRAASVVVVAFTMTTIFVGSILFLLYGEGRNNANGNFSYTAYAIATGGGSWSRANAELPELHGMTEEEANGYLYRIAATAVRQHPGRLARGIAKNGSVFWKRLHTSYRQKDHADTLKLLYAGPSCLVLAALLIHARRLSQWRQEWMLVATGLGVLASHPLLWVDAGFRVLQPVTAFLTATAVVVIVRGIQLLWTDWPSSPPDHTGETHALWSYRPGSRATSNRMPVIMAGGIAASAIILPGIAHATEDRRPVARRSCVAPVSIVTRIDSSVPRLYFRSLSGQSFTPEVSYNDFVRHGASTVTELWPSLGAAIAEKGPPVTIMLVYDLQTGTGRGTYWLISQGNTLRSSHGLVHVCGRYWSNSKVGPYRLVEVGELNPL